MIDRTKTGLLLIIIGTILAPIPYIGIIGGILALIGVILAILGRNVFGDKHARNILWSIVLYIVGVGVIFAFGVGLGISIATAILRTGTSASLSQAIISDFNNFLIGAIIGGAISGLAQVLFTYELQEPVGRTILWVAYAATIATGIVVFALAASTISTVVAQAVSGGTINPVLLSDLQGQIQAYQLIDLIPAALYALAYYLVWDRINRGELPKQTAQPPPSLSNLPTMPMP